MAKKATGARQQKRNARSTTRRLVKSDARQLAEDMLAALEIESCRRFHFVPWTEPPAWGIQTSEKKVGRPRRKEWDGRYSAILCKGLKVEDIKGGKLERAIYAHMPEGSDVGARSSNAITYRIIKDRNSGYFQVPPDTMFKRVNAVLKNRGKAFWLFWRDRGSPIRHSAQLPYKATEDQPPAELLHELGLQSFERPGLFAELIVYDYANK